MYTPEELNRKFTELTEKYMVKAGIPIRDTWKGYDGENFDDREVNQKLNGPRYLKINVGENDVRPNARYHKHYTIEPDYSDLAYDQYEVSIPKYLVHRTNAVIHEFVHFLQQASANDVYIESSVDREGYLSQRCELEAHFVQLLYLRDAEAHIIPEEILEDFDKRLELALIDVSERLEFIKWACDVDII